MKLKSFKKIIGATSIATALLLTPIGSNISFSNAETLPTEAFINYQELQKQLKQIEKISKGKVKVDVVGQTNQGRDIYKASVGTGNKVILIQSEIHGNEKTGTVALLNILKNLGTTNSPKVKEILKEVTLVMIPMLNADGSELDRRGNDMTWAEVTEQFPQLREARPSWNYYTTPRQGDDYASKPGFDVNRDFHPNLEYVPQAADFPGNSSMYGWYITPESQTVRDVYKELKEQFGEVDVFIDLHHQGFPYVGDTENVATISLSGKFVYDPNQEGSRYAQYKEEYNYDFSRQLNLAAYNALQEKGNSIFTYVSLYDQNIDLPGTALGSFALNGSGTVLFEVKGQTQNFGQKMNGQLVKTVETGLMGIINGVTDNSVYQLNPEDYENIPPSTH